MAKWTALFLGAAIWLQGCTFSTFRPETIDPQAATLVGGAPAKVFLKDGTIILFQNGFNASPSHISGNGLRLALNGAGNPNQEPCEIPLGEIAAMTYLQNNSSVATGVGTFILDLTAVPLSVLSVYCLACPKCCFGSCPTVYVQDMDRFIFRSELFPWSICAPMEASDQALLVQDLRPAAEDVIIRITNEALETHYINMLRPLLVLHPKGTSVFPAQDGGWMTFRQFLPAARAINSEGNDILPLIATTDDRVYRSPDAMVELLKKRPFFDNIELEVRPPDRARAAKVLITMRPTLMSTVLFYEVVLGSLGLDALRWIEKMNTDRSYAKLFQSIYESFSGLTVSKWENNAWIRETRLKDPGPLAYKKVAFRLPVAEGEDLRLRLEFVPDYIMFDCVAFDFETEPEEAVAERPLKWTAIPDQDGQESDSFMHLLDEKDDLYLSTEPGQSFRLQCHLGGQPPDNLAASLCIQASGYYHEWIRGHWIAFRPGAADRFNFLDVRGYFAKLANAWLSNKKLMEDVFFKTRIPLRSER